MNRIEWKTETTYKTGDYEQIKTIGKVGGVVAFMVDHYDMYLWTMFTDDANFKCESLDQAKAKAEELYKTWRTEAGLFCVEDIVSCDKCGNSGVVKVELSNDPCWWPPSYWGAREIVSQNKPCDCRKIPHSLYSITQLVGEL